MEISLKQKAVPIVLRSIAGQNEILVFTHPLAGIQLVKGSIEPGETAEAAAVRELAEESGLVDVSQMVNLGDQIYQDIEQHWHFHRCCFERHLPDSWEFFTQDDGGHLFRFHWWPIGDKIGNPLGPVFDWAREFVRQAVV